MSLIDFINNSNPLMSISFLDQLSIQIVHFLSVFLINFISYLYILVKFYKVMCYSKLTFEWLPMINPYYWPFSIFEGLTAPYFAFWQRVFPSIKLKKGSFDISRIMALESLNSLTFFCIRGVTYLIDYLEQTEKILAASS